MIVPWEEIEERYRDLVESGANAHGMLRLVEQIKASPYVRGLHAWTSMHDLCVVQVPGADAYEGPYLRITPFFDGRIEFRYVDTYITARQWSRVVKEEEAFSRLERFIDQLHWVARET